MPPSRQKTRAVRHRRHRNGEFPLRGFLRRRLPRSRWPMYDRDTTGRLPDGRNAMNDVAARTDTLPLLRTLSPALRGLERSLRGWLDAPHRYPLSTIHRATLEGLAIDLHRQAERSTWIGRCWSSCSWAEPGVGKSTLLNALAGGAIAQASFHSAHHARSGRLLSRVDQARSARSRFAPLPTRPARSAGTAAKNPRRYARPRQQRPEPTATN